MKKNLVLCGFLSLFLGAFLDNSRGALLPLIQKQLNLSYSELSLFLIIGCFSAFPSLLLIISLKQKYSQNTLLKTAVFFTMGVLSLNFLTWSRPLFFVYGSLLGISLAWFGTLCNFWVIKGTPVHRQAKVLCGLHVMYGVGSFFAPQMFRWVEVQNLPLSYGYILTIPVIFGILGLLYFSIKEQIWEKHEVRTEKGKIDSLDLLFIITFSVYVAAEVMTSMWMQTALMQSKNFSYPEAATELSYFFGFMVLSRFLCVFLVKTEWIPRIIMGCLMGGALTITIGQLYWPKAFMFAGIVGPFFPLFLAYLNHHFPERAGKLTLILMAFVQFTLGFCHLLLGSIADKIGIGISYFLPIGLFLFTFLLFVLVVRKVQGVTSAYKIKPSKVSI